MLALIQLLYDYFQVSLWNNNKINLLDQKF